MDLTTYVLTPRQFTATLGMLGAWWRLGDSLLRPDAALRIALLAAHLGV